MPPVDYAHFKSIIKNVAAAGTQEPIIADTYQCHTVIIKPKKGNANDVYIGGPDVAAANGFCLVPTAQPITIEDGSGSNGIQAKDIWVDAAANGDGVEVLLIKK